MSSSSYIVIQTNAAPYSSGKAVDALEAALAASNIGMAVKFVFANDGVYQLMSHQHPESIQHKNISKKLSALPLFDIEDIFVCDTSAGKRNINSKNNPLIYSLAAKLITQNELLALKANANQVLMF